MDVGVVWTVMLSHKFQGMDQFSKTLRGLDLSKAKGVKVAILKRAAEPMRETAEQLVQIGEEAPHIVDHIVVQVLSRLDDEEFGGKRAAEADEAVVAIGPTKDFPYGHLIEFGTAPHGNHPGTPAHPFMRPSWDQNRERAVKQIQDDLWTHIQKTAERSSGGRSL